LEENTRLNVVRQRCYMEMTYQIGCTWKQRKQKYIDGSQTIKLLTKYATTHTLKHSHTQTRTVQSCVTQSSSFI